VTDTAVAQGAREPADPFVECTVSALHAVEAEGDPRGARAGMPGQLVTHHRAAARQAGISDSVSGIGQPRHRVNGDTCVNLEPYRRNSHH
jgi:hypothetical protein